jgi:hypothetical protein
MDNHFTIRADDYWVHLLDKFPVAGAGPRADSNLPD